MIFTCVAGDWKPQRTSRILGNEGEGKCSLPHSKTSSPNISQKTKRVSNILHERSVALEVRDRLITDTHFDNPDRKGRLLAFLARMYSSYGVQGKAIACDEYTAVCIDTHSIAKVFGAHPTYDDNAYFIQSNCELDDPSPENCSDGNPLTWNHGGEALKVYQVKGTESGSHTFDLNTWQSGIGGSWQNWSAEAGSFLEQPGDQIHCSPLTSIDGHNEIELKVYPNPASDRIIIHSTHENTANCKVKLFNSSGQLIPSGINRVSEHQLETDLSEMRTGMYFLMITTNNQNKYIHNFIIE